MPEGAEVERVRRVLVDVVREREVVEVRVCGRRVVRRDDPERLDRIVGQRLGALRRLGKFLVFELDEDVLVVHLGMAGRIVLGPTATEARHLQLRLELDGVSLAIVDPRTFSEAFVDRLGGGGVPTRLAHLGPDVLAAPDAAACSLVEWSRRTRRAIKTLLLDQRVVAGLGNMYADEALFGAGIHPATPASALGGRVAEVVAVGRDVLERAAAAGGTTFADRAFRDPLGRPGRFGEALRVYGRVGAPCARCGTRIERLRLHGRSSYLCPRCQQLEGR